MTIDAFVSGAPLWPLSPNWRERYTVSYEFKTDIFTSRSGREQRRAVRSTPRKVVKFLVTRTRSDARAFSRFLTRYQGPLIALPDSSRFARLIAAVTSGATVLAVDDASSNWLDGAQQVILSFAGRYGVAQVQSVDRAAMTVTLVAPTALDWPLGTKLHPPLRGRLANQISVQNYQDRTVEADIVFQVDPGTVLADDAGSPVDVFNKREVFAFNPNFLRPIEGDFRRSVDAVDFGRGRASTYLPIAFSSRAKQYQLLQPTRGERAAVVGLFCRMKGQRGEFYMPSYEDDFSLVSSGPTTATFAGQLLHDVYQSDDVRRAVMLVAGDGSRFYRRIIASSTDGSNTTLTTDIAWPLSLTAQVQVIWLLVHRFATDQLTMECVTDEAAEMQLAVLALEDLPTVAPDSIYDDLDGAAMFIGDDWGVALSSRMFDQLDRIVNVQYPHAANGA